jgi:hypothetical protein
MTLKKKWEKAGHKGLVKAVEAELAPPQKIRMSKNIELVFIEPSQLMPTIKTKSKRKLRMNFNLGYADAERNKRIKKLLGS